MKQEPGTWDGEVSIRSEIRSNPGLYTIQVDHHETENLSPLVALLEKDVSPDEN